MSDQMFYLQNVERGYVGNSVQWWKWNNCGYVCDIRAARKFTQDEINGFNPGVKFKAWPVEQIDALVQHHIDMQDLRHGSTTPHSLDGLEIPDKSIN